MFENFEFILPTLNPLNVELNPICNLLALLGVNHIPHISRVRVKDVQTKHISPSQIIRSA